MWKLPLFGGLLLADSWVNHRHLLRWHLTIQASQRRNWNLRMIEEGTPKLAAMIFNGNHKSFGKRWPRCKEVGTIRSNSSEQCSKDGMSSSGSSLIESGRYIKYIQIQKLHTQEDSWLLVTGSNYSLDIPTLFFYVFCSLLYICIHTTYPSSAIYSGIRSTRLAISVTPLNP